MALKAKTVTIEGVEYGVIVGGKPIFIDDANNNEELTFDPDQLKNKIAELNSESKQHRLSAKEAKELLEKFGPTTPEEVEALRAMTADLGGPEGIAKLKQAGRVDVEAVKKSVTDAYEIKLNEASQKIETLSARERQLLIGNGFASSAFLKETIYTPSKAEAVYGHHFKVEDGRAVGYMNGNPILSKDGTGDLATFEEAFKTIFQNDPERDSYLKPSGGGSGAQHSSSGGKSGDGKSISRAEFIAKSPAEQSALAIARVTITD